MDPTRNKVLCAGRRFGKSMLLIAEAIACAVNKEGANIWYLIAELSQAKRTIWEPMKDRCKPYAQSINNNEHLITFKNGSHLWLVPTNVDPDRLRGPGLDLALWDEYKDVKPDCRDIVAPAMSDLNRLGRSIYVGTPGGYDHFHELIEKNISNPEYSIYKYTTADGGYVSWDEILKKANEMDIKMWQQEYFAATINFAEGLSYYSFDSTQNIKPITYNPDLPIIWSLDFNVKPYCSVIMQYEPGLSPRGLPVIKSLANASGAINVIQELIIPSNGNTESMCELFKKRTMPYYQMLQRMAYGKRLEVVLTGDASGSASHTSANYSDWQQIRAFFTRYDNLYQLTYAVPDSNPHVKSRVTAVNTALCSASGLRRLFVNPECTWVKKDLENVVWADTSCTMLDQKKHKDLTHTSDALGYGVLLLSETAPTISGPMPV
jgi:hypothetical protein